MSLYISRSLYSLVELVPQKKRIKILIKTAKSEGNKLGSLDTQHSARPQEKSPKTSRANVSHMSLRYFVFLYVVRPFTVADKRTRSLNELDGARSGRSGGVSKM
jgi:hypothetical protein